MTYIVKDECIKCKLTDCVEVCPVDCFYEGENMLVINPDECIDCGVCEPECPINAIVADTDYKNEDKDKWLLLNKKFSAIWPNITKKKELEKCLKSWLDSHIIEVLGDLINLTKIKIENQYLRALSYQLYENNGVLKRKNIDDIIKLISKEERKKLWGMGIKIGRYHIFLTKMLKPKAVTLRTTLWKIHNDITFNLNIPKFGLNFVVNENYNEKFLLLCGFEKFKDYFVRIDILEKLFINIMDTTIDRKFKISPEMMNLLGCTKENFFKLITLMNLMDYKKSKDNDTYYYFSPNNKKNKDKLTNDKSKTNPFSKLLALNIK